SIKIVRIDEAELIRQLKIKPTNIAEWKKRHYITGYLNKNQKVKIYVTRELKYKHDETLINCDVPCIWKAKEIEDLTSEELKSADGLLCVDQLGLPKEKAWKGQKFIQYTLEPETYFPQYHDKTNPYDIRATYYENSDIPTSYVSMDTETWRSIVPFNITKLTPNSTFISFIASHWTQFRREFIPNLEKHIPVASFGGVYRNTDWYPECPLESKNCIISKFPFYLAIENCQEKDYSTEKLWNTFNLGVVPVIWGAPNTRLYLPHPKSAIFIEDFKDAKALADYLKYLVKK
ncbi:13035_t:CDS:2, partial [Racocetra fulgida]